MYLLNIVYLDEQEFESESFFCMYRLTYEAVNSVLKDLILSGPAALCYKVMQHLIAWFSGFPDTVSRFKMQIISLLSTCMEQ